MVFRVALVALLLSGCLASPYVAPHLTRLPVPAVAPDRGTEGPGAERWWSVLLHTHSVLNFVWLYDHEAELVRDERRDRRLRRAGRVRRMRNYDPEGIRRLLGRAARRGLDAMILTEHNTLLHARDPWLPRRVGRTRLFRQATEWTAWSGGGHALLLGLKEPLRPRSSRRAKVADYRRMTAAARAQGAVVIVAHPTTPNSPWKRLPFPAAAHAIEVLNSWPFDGRGSEDLWHQALRRGARLGAVAGADWHATPGPPVPGGWRITRVRAPALTEEAIYAAIGAGHTVAENGGARRATVQLLVGGRCREGDDCALAPGRPFRIEARVLGGAGMTLELFDDRSPSAWAPSARLPVVGRVFRVALERTLAPGTRGFVRAALRGIETRAVGSAVDLRAGAGAPP